MSLILKKLAGFFLCGYVALLPAYVCAATYIPGEVLVKYKNTVRPDSIDTLIESGSQQPAMAGLEKLVLKKGVTVEQALHVLKMDPAIEYAQPNYIKRWQKIPNDQQFSLQWALKNTAQLVPTSGGPYVSGFDDADIDADSAWDVTTGSSTIIVAVIDSGIDITHPDISANLWHNPNEILNNGLDEDDGGIYVDDDIGWDFVNNDNFPVDLSGHGTHVAGIIAAKGNDSSTVAGVSWNTSLMVLQVVDANGVTTSSGIAAAIRYAVDKGAKVINASYGETVFDQSEYDAIDYANSNGVLVVAAACNDSSDNDSTPCYPSSYNLPNIIAVAASDMFDNKASFSNWGAASVDLAAPGVSIVSTYPRFDQVWSHNFSGGGVGWTYGGISNLWAVSANTLDDSPAANYAANTNSWAQSPAINLTGRSSCRISTNFKSISIEKNVDKIFIEGSTTGVGVWTAVGEVASGDILNHKADITSFDNASTFYFRYRLNSDGAIQNAGVSINSVTIDCYGTHDQSSYAFMDGTSTAAPFVSGAAALLLAKSGSLTVTEVRDQILNSVDEKSTLTGLVASGGRLNVATTLSASSAGGSGGGGAFSITWLLSLAAFFVCCNWLRLRKDVFQLVRRICAVFILQAEPVSDRRVRKSRFFLLAVLMLSATAVNAAAYREVRLDGDQQSSEYGYSTAAGDFNGDGYSDLAVGVSSYGLCISCGGTGMTDGRVYVYYGSGSGLPSAPNWTVDGTASLGAYFGGALAAGDVSGDGIDDLLVGAPGMYNYPGAGSVYVYFGASSVGLPATEDTILSPGQADDNFGMTIAVLGDVNGDTYPDLMVGAYEYDVIPANPNDNDGAVFIYYSNGTPADFSTIPPTRLDGPHAGAQFGRSVALAGDVNGDTFPDIIIGADYYYNVEQNEGAAFVYYGTGTGTGFSATPDWRLESNQASAWPSDCVCLGSSVASAGDVNNDGYDDVIIGAWQYDSTANATADDGGAAFVFYGSGSGLAGTGSSPTVAAPGDAVGASGWSVYDATIYEALGTSVAGAGDVNNDGFADVIIGIEGYCDPGNSCGGFSGDGRAVIYYGSVSGLSGTEDWSSTYTADRIGSHYGAWVIPAGDIDGDAKDDYVVSAYHYSVTSTNEEGAVFAYLSNVPEVVATPASGLSTTEAGGIATFDLVLSTEPSADVTIAIASSNVLEGTVSSSSVTFTASDWNVAQIITVTGKNDFLIDGDVAYNINLTVSSGDSNYDANNPASVTVTNVDDDVAGITVTPVSGLVTEFAASDTFTVVLTSIPLADVTIGLSSSDIAQGTVSPASLTFVSGNWNIPQTVTVTGTNASPSNNAYSVVTAAAVSGDGNFNNVNPADVSVTNRLSTVTITALANASEPDSDGSFSVTRDGSTSYPLTVNYSVIGGTATSGVDYTAPSGSVTIPAGQASATVLLTPINDTLIETTETVILAVTANAAYIADSTPATVNLADDDILPAASFASDQLVAEGSTVTVSVTLSYAAFTYPVTIPYTVSGTAANPADHNATSGVITINSGTTGSFTFTTVADGQSDTNETVIFTMGTPTNARLGSRTTHQVNLVDNTVTAAGGSGASGAVFLFVALLANLLSMRSRAFFKASFFEGGGRVIPAIDKP